MNEEKLNTLKQITTPFGLLSQPYQDWLKKANNGKNIQVFERSGNWKNISHPRFQVWSTYRLSPDFELQKERWFFNLDRKTIVGSDNPYIAGAIVPWIEITLEQKDYLENKPEVEEGFKWVLRLKEAGDTYLNIQHRMTILHSAVPGTRAIKGIRWVRVPVKAKVDLNDLAQKVIDASLLFVTEVRKSGALK